MIYQGERFRLRVKIDRHQVVINFPRPSIMSLDVVFHPGGKREKENLKSPGVEAFLLRPKRRKEGRDFLLGVERGTSTSTTTFIPT
jgi:hypothetical protein